MADVLAGVISKALGEVTGIYDTTDAEDKALADAIIAAGFGPVREAREAAWYEGFRAGWEEAKDPGAFVNDVWDAETPNPYRAVTVRGGE